MYFNKTLKSENIKFCSSITIPKTFFTGTFLQENNKICIIFFSINKFH